MGTPIPPPPLLQRQAAVADTTLAAVVFIIKCFCHGFSRSPATITSTLDASTTVRVVVTEEEDASMWLVVAFYLAFLLV